jgi:hypothetical protein
MFATVPTPGLAPIRLTSTKQPPIKTGTTNDLKSLAGATEDSASTLALGQYSQLLRQP